MCVSVFKDFFYPTLSAWRGGKGGERGGMVRERKVVCQNRSCVRLFLNLHDTCDFNDHFLIVSVQMGERLLGRGLYIF